MGWSFANIFYIGDRAKAVAEAEKKMERLYALATIDAEDLENALNSDSDYVSCANLYSSTSGLAFPVTRFCFKEHVNVIEDDDGEEEEIEGFLVTVVVFYKEGDHYIEFSFFLENDGKSDE